MYIANILPVNCVKPGMHRQPYELYLTHKILEHPDTFAFLKADPQNYNYKILDNSACELGEGLDFSKVLEAAEIIGAHEIVLPDIVKSDNSFAKTLSYLAELTPEVRRRYKIAAVCQGSTRESLLTCATQLLSLDSINTLMLPKWYCSMDNSNGLGRASITAELVKLIDAIHPEVEIHWLGLGTGLRELLTPIRHRVRSVDTGYYAAMSTPQWQHLKVYSDRPSELKIDLETMDVDTTRWMQLIDAADTIINEL